MQIYGFHDYRDFIKAKIAENSETRGYQSRLAEAAGCRASYLSQVLGSRVHLTPEHAAELSDFWSMSANEAEYFVLLVHLGRTTCTALQEILNKQRKNILERTATLTARIEKTPQVTLREQQTYYSSWLFAAIHILVSLPNYRTVQSLAARLQLPVDQISLRVDELTEMGLLETHQGQLRISKRSIHLGSESPLFRVNCSNWRQKTIARIQASPRPEDVHYSAVYSLSKADCEKLRELIFDAIQKTRELVGPSHEEEVMYFGMDLFIL